jgi:flagellin-like protein
MIMQKKAVSALVATVLLILITVAAVGIIWGAIMPMINQATQYGQACTNARVSISTDMGYTCSNTTGTSNPGFVLVNVKRGAEAFDMQGLQITITGSGTSKSWIIKQNQQARTAAGVVSTSVGQIPTNFSGLNLDVPGMNEARTYIIDTGMTGTAIAGTPSAAEAAVIVRVGNMEKSCAIASTATLTACRQS